MNHTYASLTPSDSDDIDSNSSTPTFESPPSPARKNVIRDLIATYEKQLKLTEFKIPTHLKQRLDKQFSADCFKDAKPKESGRNSWDSTPENTDKFMIDDVNLGVEEHEYCNVERKKFKAELTRTLTEIRKSYVRRVCSTIRKKKDNELDESPHLFECCLLVELNMMTLTPYVKGKYPADFEVPPWVEHLCYPDAPDWSPEILKKTTTNQNKACQCYSLVITNEKGERKFGYCRRVLPEEASVCLPLTYCIISSFRAPGFYYKVLQELESRHGSPHWLQNFFLRELYNSKFPKPGQSVKISCLLRVLLVDSCDKLNKPSKNESERKMDKNDETNNEWVLCDKEEYDKEVQKNIYGILNKLRLNYDEITEIDKYVKEFRSNSVQVQHEKIVQNSSTNVQVLSSQLYNVDNVDFNSFTLMLNLPNSQLIHDCLLGDVVFRRPFDHRIEDTDLTVLFETLNLNVLLQTFGSLLLERKVIFISKCLGQLSSCVEAMQSILYPFSWQHTFIPVLSSNMLDILSAPLPLVAGVLASHLQDEVIVEDGIAVNLDTSTVVCSVGDEPGILPKRLRNGLSLALQLVTTASSVDGSRNVLVSEAFMRMFVEVCGHYRQFITINDKQDTNFDKEGFVKHHTSKSAQMFLEWFTETAMFHTFIQSQCEAVEDDNIFEQRCSDLNNERQKNRGMKKMKNFFKS